MFAGDAVFPGEVHWGTRCPMFVGDAVFPSEVHQLPNFCRGSGCHHPQTILPVGMLCTTYTQILKVVYTYHICIEMYHEVLSLLQTAHINGMLCTAWLE